MLILITVLHVIACVALILIVLLQRGKGADLGAAFGGSSQTIFGSQGAGGFLTRVTTVAAVVFMCTSLGLAYLASHRVQATIMEGTGQVQEEAAQPAPTETEGVGSEEGSPAPQDQQAPQEAPGDAAAPEDAAAKEG